MVQPVGVQLFARHPLAARDALRIRLAEGEVAGDVLVVERVVEQQAALADRAVVGHERDLAEIARAVVHRNGGVEHVLAARGPRLDDAPVPDGEADVLDDAAVVHQRQRGTDRTVHAGFERRGEDLLRWQIGDEADARGRFGVAHRPEMILRQLDGEVGAEGVGVVQTLEVQRVELFSARGQQRDMLVPALRRPPVAGNANGGENRVPKGIYRRLLFERGEHLPRPRGNGRAYDAPRKAVGHLQAVEGLSLDG